MRRFSIRGLMGFVLLTAVGLAAAMAGAFTFALVTLSATTIGVVITRGRLQAFCLGCTAVGWTCMLVAFGSGPDVRLSLPTIRPIVRVYEAINGPGPTTFKSPEEASRWIKQLTLDVNQSITTGHALISLALALTGGIILWLLSHWRRQRGNRVLGGVSEFSREYDRLHGGGNAETTVPEGA